MSYKEWPRITNIYWDLRIFYKSYQELQILIKGHKELARYTKSYKKLPRVINSYKKVPKIYQEVSIFTENDQYLIKNIWETKRDIQSYQYSPRVNI